MRLIKITLLLLISFNVPFKVISANDLQNILRDNGKIIFIRHAYAPGGGDPDGFDIANCASQRNLNSEGIEQSKRIGKFFEENDIINNNVELQEIYKDYLLIKDTFKDEAGLTQEKFYEVYMNDLIKSVDG